MFIDGDHTFTKLKNHNLYCQQNNRSILNIDHHHHQYNLINKDFQNFLFPRLKTYDIHHNNNILLSSLLPLKDIFCNSKFSTKKIEQNLKNQSTVPATKEKKLKINMPPITEKRSPSILKSNVKENFPSGNSTTIPQNKQQQPLSDKTDNRVPEIIDFRDTWLEEIEMYKDQIKVQQQQFLLIQQQQQQQNNYGHNHNSHYHHSNRHVNYDEEIPTTTTISTTPTVVTSNVISQQQQRDNAKNVDSIKRRIRTRSDSDSYDKSSNEADDGLVLKRAREDNCTSPTSAPTLLSSSSSSSALNNKNKVSRHENNNTRHTTKSRNHRKRKSPSPPSTIVFKSSSLSPSSSSETSKVLSENDQIKKQYTQEQEQLTTTTVTVLTPKTTTTISNDSCHTNLLNNSQQPQQQQQNQKLENSKTNPVTNKNTNGFSALAPQTPHSSLSNSNNNNDNKKTSGTVTTTNVISSSKLLEQSSKLIKSPATIESVATITMGREGALNSHSSIAKDDKKIEEIINLMTNDNEIEYEDDDDLIGDIDEADIYESSDDDDEYVGYAYYLEFEEEDLSSRLMAKNNSHYITPKQPLSPSLFPNVPPYINFSSHAEKGPTLPNEIQKILKWKLTNVMPKIVKKVIANSGFRLMRKPIEWMGTWEKHMKSPCFKTILPHQKFNHLPGTFKIGRKDSVWRNLNLFSEKHGKREFGFMPKTYILPQDLDPLKKVWPRYAKNNTKWIIKPPASARGTGIKVVNRWSQIPKTTPLIVQKYIERPLLIEGNKFDLRLYVIVTSINPLRIFLHTDGLARFASVQYSDKLDTLNDRCMHLTNYSINKLSSNYAKNENINACQGHKWTLKSLWSYFNKRGVNTKRLWATLRNLIIRTIISGESCLNKMLKQNVSSKYSCYELFGFDVLLDENLIPWLLEVNISPSLHSELPLDQHVKGPLVQAVLNTALYQIPSKISEQVEKQVLREYNLKGPLCYDKRIFTACLSPEEIRKHNQFTNRSIEDRDDYISTILDNLTPDDVRCLIIAEDELARSKPLERIFPGSESYMYLKFLEGPRYYNRLLDAWETKYSNNRSEGIQLLQELCKTEYHLQVSPSALMKYESEENLQKQQQNEDKDAIDDNDLVRSDSQLSITTTITTNCDDDDDDNNTNSAASNISSLISSNNETNSDSSNSNNATAHPSSSSVSTAPVSCSKEAAVTVVVTTTDTESQLNNGPRPIVVETQ